MKRLLFAKIPVSRERNEKFNFAESIQERVKRMENEGKLEVRILVNLDCIYGLVQLKIL